MGKSDRNLLAAAVGIMTFVTWAAAACSSTSVVAPAPAGDASDDTTDPDASTGVDGSSDARVTADDGSIDVPACDPAHPGDCASNEYCQLAGCAPGTGVCTKKPAASDPDLSVGVCGCDGIQYWNETLAASRGASLQTACLHDSLVTCGGPTNTACPAGTYCQYAGTCQAGSDKGWCWAVPATCDTISGSLSECGAEAGAPTACTNLCVLTKNEKPWGGAPLGTCN
jgi:hypothetical protein